MVLFISSLGRSLSQSGSRSLNGVWGLLSACMPRPDIRVSGFRPLGRVSSPCPFGFRFRSRSACVGSWRRHVNLCLLLRLDANTVFEAFVTSAVDLPQCLGSCSSFTVAPTCDVSDDARLRFFSPTYGSELHLRSASANPASMAGQYIAFSHAHGADLDSRSGLIRRNMLVHLSHGYWTDGGSECIRIRGYVGEWVGGGLDGRLVIREYRVWWLS